MRTYDEFEEAIQNQDIRGLRVALTNICYMCRDFSDGEFSRMLGKAKRTGLEFMDEYDGKGLVSERKKAFEDDDFAIAVFELTENFCEERINDVKIIGKALYGKSTSGTILNEKKNNENPSGGGVERQRRTRLAEHQKQNQEGQSQGGLIAIVLVVVIGIVAILLHLI